MLMAATLTGHERMLLFVLQLWTILACIQRTCDSAAPTLMTAATEADLLAGFGNPDITVIIMLKDIILSANCTVNGAPPGAVYKMTRNVTVTVPDGQHATTNWYPTLDVTDVMSPKILIPDGIMLTYDHIMFANVGPYHSYTVGNTGYGMPYIHGNSTGTLHLLNGVLFVPFCSQSSAAMRLWASIPRSPLFPGTQRAKPLVDGWCAVPDPGAAYAGQCWANAYMMIDVVWQLDFFFPNTTLADEPLHLFYENLVVLCNQLTSGPPSSQPALPPLAPPPRPRPLDVHDGSRSPSTKPGIIIGAALGAAALVMLVTAAVGLLYWRRWRMHPRPLASPLPSSSNDPAERFDDEVQKERNRFTCMLDQLKAQERRCSSTLEDACGGSPKQNSISSDNPLNARGLSALAVKCELLPETSSADSTTITSSSPDLVDELHEMSRSMQTSIRDKQLHIEAVIGSGAFGTVYRGSWQGLPVAIKTLMFSSHTMGAAANQSQSVLTEAALSKSIAHRNVVATYSCDLQRVATNRNIGTSLSINDTGDVVNDWRLYIIQEYCDGGSLYAALQCSGILKALKGPRAPSRLPGGPPAGVKLTFDLETVLELAGDIACGMSHLHERNVIHGDLNPANVLLKRRDSGRWIPKVCDFGFSVHLPANKSHVSNTRRGTPFYVAPEVMQCGKMSRAADVFAMGVMLWELYMGQTVWRESAAGAPELQAAFPRLPKDTPQGYIKLLLDCIKFDAQQRPTFNNIMERLAELQNAFVPKAPGVMVSAAVSGACSSLSQASPNFYAANVAVPASDHAPAAADVVSSIASYDYDYCYGSAPPSAAPSVAVPCSASASGGCVPSGNMSGGESGSFRSQVAVDMYSAVQHTGMSGLFPGAPDSRNVPTAAASTPPRGSQLTQM